MANFKIGELAAAAEVGRDTIRYYERLGLLQASSRSQAGYRLYNDDELARLKFIRSVQDLGFTLEQTRDLLEASAAAPSRVEDLLAVTRGKLIAAESNIGRLRQVEQLLADQSSASQASCSQPLWMRLRTEKSSAEHLSSDLTECPVDQLV
ncbi:MAG: hypothetical protein B7Y36_16265 [Novosphingobium sp. 28-62-57]|jgi:DNA-binding transcriptional MerR regulator|uniref:MerR family transcriptional regulator n=1 Tax=unclassified Novosphingobium TaxID=2644732 RepID=UPI0009315FC8|nr:MULTISPECIES: MerR family transcriptional regulator [unclassified Novosphingobium]MBY0393129.1 MerR family transcriptional regulator [Novosphingobium sp.]OYZ08707.1 MAG: hypothetical protein B7Y36_16265 [Novosphingobium sp. 28-62-57]OZA40566.1 MAG: hypothetical protein B7X92_01105 [Novosphingobium sp. 17-62-9]